MSKCEINNIDSDEWLVLPHLDEFIEKMCDSNELIEAVIGSGSFFRGLQNTPYDEFRFKNKRIKNINFGVCDGVDLRFVYNRNIILTPKKEEALINIGNKPPIEIISYHKSIVTDRKNILAAKSNLDLSVSRIYAQGRILYSNSTNNGNKLGEIYELREQAIATYSNPPFEKDNKDEVQSRLDAISEMKIEIIKAQMKEKKNYQSLKSLLLTLCLYLNGVWEPRKRYERKTHLLIDPQYYQLVFNLSSLEDIEGLLLYINKKYCYDELIKIDPRENLNKLREAGLH